MNIPRRVGGAQATPIRGGLKLSWNALSLTPRKYVVRMTPGGLLEPEFAFESIDPDQENLNWKDASGNFNFITSDAPLESAEVGDGLVPGNSAHGIQALIADLSAPWWISCWRTISAGTIGADDTVFGITLNEADGTVFDSYLAVLTSGNQFQFFTAGGGNSGAFTIAASGEHLFGVRVYLSGLTLMGQLYVDGIAAGSPFTITLGSGGPEGCTFANGLAGSSDNPLLYSVWGKQGAITAATLLKIYNAGVPLTYANRPSVDYIDYDVLASETSYSLACPNGTTLKVRGEDGDDIGDWSDEVTNQIGPVTYIEKLRLS